MRSDAIVAIPANHKTYLQARKVLPADAEWSCMFGNPGNPGFEERWRDGAGRLWIIANGNSEVTQNLWQVTLRS